MIENVQQFSSTANPIQGVRGWLRWLCICLTILAPLSYVADASSAFRTTYDLSQSPLRTFVLLACAVEIALAAASMYAGLSLWRVTPGAARKAMAFFWMAIGYVLLSNVALYCLATNITPDKIIQSSLAPVLGGLVWIAYLESSKRVKATYGE